MSEKNEKKYTSCRIAKVKADKTVIAVDGFVTKKGIEDIPYENHQGTKVDRVRLYISVPNRAKSISDSLGISTDSLMKNSSSKGDEYVTLPVTFFGYTAKYVKDYVRSGYLIDVFGELYASESKGKTYVNINAFGNPNIRYKPANSNTAATTTAQAKPAPSAEPESVDEFPGETLDFTADDLPF